jgi:hypothetical protein
MNSRFLVGVVVLVAALAAVGYWMRDTSRGGGDVPAKAPDAAGATPGGAGGTAAVQAPGGESAPGTLPATPDAAARSAEPPAPELALEAVTPLLELNVIAAGASGDASVEQSTEGIDLLLEGRHGTKTRAQLELSYRSILAALAGQKSPETLTKEQILSPDAVSALELEASWLKERIVR